MNLSNTEESFLALINYSESELPKIKKYLALKGVERYSDAALFYRTAYETERPSLGYCLTRLPLRQEDLFSPHALSFDDRRMGKSLSLKHCLFSV
jgi:hypothetical protein